MATEFKGNLSIVKYENNAGGNLNIAGQLTVGAVLFTDKLNGASIAPLFSASSTYVSGDKVIYDGSLYECSQDISLPGEWTGLTHWTKITLSSMIPFLQSSGKISENYLPSNSYWSLIEVNQNSYLYTPSSHTNTQCNQPLLSLNITSPSALNLDAILRFTSGQTPTVLTLSGSIPILFTGDHTASGIFSPQSYFDYAIRFISVGNKIIGTVSAVSSLTETAVSGTSAFITAASGNYYKCSETLTSLSLTLSGLTSGTVKINFTAGTSMTLTGLSGVTMVGTDCADGVLMPIAGKSYTITLTASDGVIKGEVSYQNVSPIGPFLLVSAPTGTRVTASNGVKEIIAVSENGFASLYLPASGTWNVSGAFGAIAADNTASITAQEGVTSHVTLTFSTVKVYGVRIYKNNSSSVLERLGDAADLEFTPKKAIENSDGTITTTQTGYSDFDNLAIYKDIKTCYLRNNSVFAYEGQEGFSWVCELGIKIIVTSVGSEFKVSTYYNGNLISTKITNDGGLGHNLVFIPIGSRSLSFNNSRNNILTAGTYYMSGGTSTSLGSIDCGGENLATAGDTGTWSNYTSSGDIVVEIPKYYLKVEYTSTTTTIWLSNAKGAGFVTSPAHADRGDGGGERDKVYIGRYLSNSSFRSVSNTSGSNYTDKIASFRTGYSSRGSGFYNFGYCEYMTLAYLYLIETANLNSQTSVGSGVTTGTANPQGESDSLGYHSGVLQKWDSENSSNESENRSSVLYRGIENIWGNTQYFLDGARYINGYLAYCINPLLYVSTETGKDNYKLIKGTVFYPSVTYITSMIWDTETQWAMGVGGYSASGSSSTYWCDTFKMLKVSEIVVLGLNTENTDSMNSGFWSHRYASYNPSTETDCSRMVYLG